MPDNLTRLQPNKENPRKISPKRLTALRKAMLEFGDLGGVILAGDGTLIGGHQRINAFRDDPDTQIQIERRYAKPTRAGTTAEGYVLIGNERFSYRETNWEGARAKAAMLAANKNAGEWDLGQVSKWIDDLATVDYDLDLTLFDADERLALLTSDDGCQSKAETQQDKTTTHICPSCGFEY